MTLSLLIRSCVVWQDPILTDWPNFVLQSPNATNRMVADLELLAGLAVEWTRSNRYMSDRKRNYILSNVGPFSEIFRDLDRHSRMVSHSANRRAIQVATSTETALPRALNRRPSSSPETPEAPRTRKPASVEQTTSELPRESSVYVSPSWR